MEQLWQHLTAEFLVLHTYPNALNISGAGHCLGREEADPSTFDDLDDESNEAEPSSERQIRQDNDMLPPKQKSVILPSTHLPIGHALGNKERALHIKQVTCYLVAIWEAVAEKSFQYSHCIRHRQNQSEPGLTH